MSDRGMNYRVTWVKRGDGIHGEGMSRTERVYADSPRDAIKKTQATLWHLYQWLPKDYEIEGVLGELS